MPIIMNCDSEQFMTEKLLLDSGAESYICPGDYAPECLIEPLPRDLPRS